jgi:hypothetical protein
MVSRSAAIATVTINSIRVKPLWFFMGDSNRLASLETGRKSFRNLPIIYPIIVPTELMKGNSSNSHFGTVTHNLLGFLFCNRNGLMEMGQNENCWGNSMGVHQIGLKNNFL